MSNGLERIRPANGIPCFAIIALVAAASPALAQTSTIDKVRSTHAITIGYRDTVIPMSYDDSQGKPIGYSIDVCARIVDELKLETGVPSLSVHYVAIKSAQRTAVLVNGTIDLECSLTAHTVQREQSVDFTLTTFLSYSGLAWKSGSGIKRLSDLQGKRVTAASGIVPLQLFNAINSQRKLGAIIVPAKTAPEAFDLMAKGEADACIMSDFEAQYHSAIHSVPIEHAKEKLLVLNSAIVLRKNDLAFKEVANRAIIKLFRTGDIYKIYHTWFEAPIPPKGVALNLPMNDAFKRIIEHPTDSPDPTVYK
jgi:glutamate/aspartate transport system substrate-binding protein